MNEQKTNLCDGCTSWPCGTHAPIGVDGCIVTECANRKPTSGELIATLKAQRDELLKENGKLRENAASVVIEELIYKNGVFDATMKTGFGPILAVFVREMMKAYKGENFVTSSLSFADDIDDYYITFGRKFGKSVDEKYVEVCTQRDELLAAANGIEAWWSLPNIARTVDTIEPPMRAIIEAIANAERPTP